MGTALCDRVHLERSGGTAAWRVIGGGGSVSSLHPQTAAVKWKGHAWDQGGGVQRPQSLNTNVLLMPHCEGHQEHKLNEAFIVASVYNNDPTSVFSHTYTVKVSTCARTHFVSGPLSNQSATLQPSALLLTFA